MSDFDDIGGPINRPANNSRRATPGEALGAEPSFDAGATDFLGLNQSLGAPVPNQPPQVSARGQQPPAPQAPQHAPQPGADSWLMEMPGEARPNHTPARAAAPAPAPRETSDDENAAADESGTLLNTAWQEPVRPRKRVRWVMPLAGVASLAAVALIGYPRFVREEPKNDSTEAVTEKPVLESASIEPREAVEIGPAEPEDTEPIEPSVEPGYALTDVVREPDAAAFTQVEADTQASLAEEQREEVAREPRTALEEQGLVEVVDPARARDIRGECETSSESWWSPLDAGVQELVAHELSATEALHPASTDDSRATTADAQDDAAGELVAETQPIELEATPETNADTNTDEITAATTETPSAEPIAESIAESIAKPIEGPADGAGEVAGETASETAGEVVAEASPSLPTGAQRREAAARLRAERARARAEERALAEAARIEATRELERDAVDSHDATEVSAAEPASTTADETALEPIAAPEAAVEPTREPVAPLEPEPNAPSTEALALEALASTVIGAPSPLHLQVKESEPPVGPPAPRELVLTADAPAPEVCSVQQRTTRLAVETVLLLDHVNGVARVAPVRTVNPMNFDPSIPFASISSKTKVLTPTVGKVRAVLNTGEIFEGVLYAVGEESLWIDTQVGRMGLLATRVRSVLQIDTPKDAPALGAAGSQNSTGLERVRIKTRGGPIYGKVLERNGDQTTVITDDGARLTVASSEVESLSELPNVRLKSP